MTADLKTFKLKARGESKLGEQGPWVDLFLPLWLSAHSSHQSRHINDTTASIANLMQPPRCAIGAILAKLSPILPAAPALLFAAVVWPSKYSAMLNAICGWPPTGSDSRQRRRVPVWLRCAGTTSLRYCRIMGMALFWPMIQIPVAT